MKSNQKRTYLLTSLLGVLGTMGIVSFYGQSSEEYEDLASKSRTTVLGKAEPSLKKEKGEFDVKFADASISQKWDLEMTAAKEAWFKHKAIGSRDVVVAIIDTGIDRKHADLKNNIWTNTGETGKDEKGRDKATNGVDDDKNGYVDDVHGWNFVENNNVLTDNHGHGTHVAGIVGAEGGNGIGISGISPRVSMMILKYYDPKSPAVNNLKNTIRAIQYAVKMKARIINYSGGGLEPSSEEKSAIELAQREGILFVAAAGNEHSNSDVKKYYPADYGLNNIISVTAIDKNRNVLPTSNYGINSVDVAAPGNNILSTLPDGKYGNLTGTSQATAFVTGVAALIMAKFPDFDAQKVIKHINQTGDLDDKLIGKTRFAKRLNTYRALAILDQGVGVTGGVAQNTNNMPPRAFASDAKMAEQMPTDPAISDNSVGSIASFNRALQKAMTQPKATKLTPTAEGEPL